MPEDHEPAATGPGRRRALPRPRATPPSVGVAVLALLGAVGLLLGPALLAGGTGTLLVLLSPAAGALALVLGVLALGAPAVLIALTLGLLQGAPVARGLLLAAGAAAAGAALGPSPLSGPVRLAAALVVLAAVLVVLAPGARRRFVPPSGSADCAARAPVLVVADLAGAVGPALSLTVGAGAGVAGAGLLAGEPAAPAGPAVALLAVSALGVVAGALGLLAREGVRAGRRAARDRFVLVLVAVADVLAVLVGDPGVTLPLLVAAVLALAVAGVLGLHPDGRRHLGAAPWPAMESLWPRSRPV